MKNLADISLEVFADHIKDGKYNDASSCGIAQACPWSVSIKADLVRGEIVGTWEEQDEDGDKWIHSALVTPYNKALAILSANDGLASRKRLLSTLPAEGFFSLTFTSHEAKRKSTTPAKRRASAYARGHEDGVEGNPVRVYENPDDASHYAQGRVAGEKMKARKSAGTYVPRQRSTRRAPKRLGVPA